MLVKRGNQIYSESKEMRICFLQVGLKCSTYYQKNERSLSEVLSEVLKKKEYEKIKTIIDILQEKGSISPKEAEATCKKSSATTRRYMKLLVETGYVIQEGSTNSTVYKNILY